MTPEEFEKLVDEAVLELPEDIRKKMDNVEIVVEMFPSEEQLRKTGIRQGNFLLGLYEGVPKTQWGRGFGMTLPDKISIFQNSIEGLCRDALEIKEMVKNVVWHEIAHHFGFDEKGVRDLEKKRKNK